MTARAEPSKEATIHAVVRRLPPPAPGTPARERVRAQSAAARAALRESARRAGCPHDSFPSDPDGAPLPIDGWHWSVSHCATGLGASGLVAGAVHRERVGIDVEHVALRRAHLREAVLDAHELALLGHVDASTFTRLWTAKEAVLKAAGVGLVELSSCRLTEHPGPDWLCLTHRGRRCIVKQIRHEEHVVAVHAPGRRWQVAWDLR